MRARTKRARPIRRQSAHPLLQTTLPVTLSVHQRSDRGRDAELFFPAAPDGGRVYARILVHTFIIYFYLPQTQNVGGHSIPRSAAQIVALSSVPGIGTRATIARICACKVRSRELRRHADIRPRDVPVPPCDFNQYQLSSASRSAIAVVMRSIIESVVSSGCMAGNSGEWHSVIVHIASACTICRR